jgi:glycine/D-amino acid oxidase-like deaminating enzyme
VASAVVVGSGIFGVTAALSLRRRGRDVVLVDPGPVPHPLAESTDISKIVRLDYGSDELYTELMERALAAWRAWPFFHETGVLFLTRGEMQPGSFEHDSLTLLERRGHRLDRLDARAIAARFPMWNAQIYTDGYFNPEGGFAESGKVVAWLAGLAKDEGVRIVTGAIASLVDRGVVLRDGTKLEADAIVLAVGSWTSHLVPSLAPCLFSVGQPVFHLASDLELPVFTADIARTGWYGFPALGGVVKIANHGVGRAMHPESPSREVTEEEHASLRAFLRETFPALADAAVVRTRVCVYGDTHDQHFWIAPDPDREWLVVAAGGSGHGFKFAPLLGDLIADAVEGRVVPRFRWRPEIAGARGEERARANPTSRPDRG